MNNTDQPVNEPAENETENQPAQNEPLAIQNNTENPQNTDQPVGDDVENDIAKSDHDSDDSKSDQTKDDLKSDQIKDDSKSDQGEDDPKPAQTQDDLQPANNETLSPNSNDDAQEQQDDNLLEPSTELEAGKIDFSESQIESSDNLPENPESIANTDDNRKILSEENVEETGESSEHENHVSENIDRSESAPENHPEPDDPVIDPQDITGENISDAAPDINFQEAEKNVNIENSEKPEESKNFENQDSIEKPEILLESELPESSENCSNIEDQTKKSDTTPSFVENTDQISSPPVLSPVDRLRLSSVQSEKDESEISNSPMVEILTKNTIEHGSNIVSDVRLPTAETSSIETEEPTSESMISDELASDMLSSIESTLNSNQNNSRLSDHILHSGADLSLPDLTEIEKLESSFDN